MPRPCSRLAKAIGTSVMFIFGWKKAGNIPRHRNVVVIAAPHTSNWDFIFLIAAAYSFGFSFNWLGKDSLFKTPLSPIFRFLGGIPVNRSEPGNLVKTITDRIKDDLGIAIVVPPSGTRKKTDYWKSGFYRIAQTAKIPIVCGYLDYKKKEAGLGPSFFPTDLISDMNFLRNFYSKITAKYPSKKSLIRLKDENQNL